MFFYNGVNPDHQQGVDK